MSTARADRPRTRAAVTAAGLVTLHSVVVLVGWAAGWSIFLTPSPSFIPMAPTTALAFLALSLALLSRKLAPSHSTLRTLGAVLSWTVATMALVNIVLPAMLDQSLGGATGQFGRVALGVMSPVTAAALVPLALAIAATGPRPHYAGALATISAIIGATVALGYVYGTPLLYGGGTIPVALPTGLSLLILGVATVLTAGPDVWPLDRLVGDQPRARMLRAFLPATAGLVVLIGLLDARLGGLFGGDRVLIAAWFAVIGVALVALLVSRLSRHIANRIDQVNLGKQRAERRFNDVFDQTIVGFATTRLGDGRMMGCNDVCAKLFGYDSVAEFLADQPRNLWWDPRDRELMLEKFRETPMIRNLEARLRRKDGTPIWVLANLTKRERDDGTPILDNIFIDITDRKSL